SSRLEFQHLVGRSGLTAQLHQSGRLALVADLQRQLRRGRAGQLIHCSSYAFDLVAKRKTPRFVLKSASSWSASLPLTRTIRKPRLMPARSAGNSFFVSNTTSSPSIHRKSRPTDPFLKSDALLWNPCTLSGGATRRCERSSSASMSLSTW